MQEQLLLLVCTSLGLLFTNFPVRSACLCTTAITGFALWSHIVAACTLLGQQTITVTLCFIHCVRFVPSVLTAVSSALAAATSRAKRIIASKHTWTVVLNILRRSAACSLKAIGAVALSVIKVSKQFASCNSQAEMHLLYKLTQVCAHL